MKETRLVKVLLPMVTGGIFFVLYLWFVYHIPLNKLYAFNTTWNDEVLYYKQLSAVLTQGYPRGYFGYNESCADWGAFGTWGPVLFYIYALPALLVGLTPNMVVFCNVFFVLVAWSVFVNCTGISWKRQVLMAGILCLMQVPMRYILSGMSEALGYAVILVIIRISYSQILDYKLWKQVCLITLCIVYSLIRPYAIVFWIFPICLFKNRNYKAVLLSLIMILGNLVVSVFFMQKLSAPYFYDSISNDGLEMILSGEVIKGVREYFESFSNAVFEAVKFIVNEFAAEKGMQGIVFASMFLLMGIMGICLFNSYKFKSDWKLKICMFLSTLFIFLIVASFYAMHRGFRHILIPCIGMVAVLILDDKKFSMMALLSMLVIFMEIKWEETSYPMRYEETTAKTMEQYGIV